MFTGTTLPIVVALAALASSANAHGYLEEPSPTWVDSPNPEWIVNIDNYWDIGSGGDQCGLFKTMTEEKGVTVKDVVLEMVNDDSKKCGNTLAGTEPLRPFRPMGWPNGWAMAAAALRTWVRVRFTSIIPWCCTATTARTSIRVATSATVTSDMPIDYSSCNGDCTLTIYWLAFQNEQ